MKASEKIKTDTKWVFIKQGTCSRTFFYILNREFGHPREAEERAIDPLAGGIMQNGYQCGQLWGAVMALGAEALRRTTNLQKATGLAFWAGNTYSTHLQMKLVLPIAKILCKPICQKNTTSQNY